LNILEAAKKIVAIDSTRHNGASELIDFVAGLSESLGLGYEKLQAQRGHKGSSEIKIFFKDQPAHKANTNNEIVFLTSLITADPGAHSLWEKTLNTPFKIHLEKDVVYGLGVAKAKLDFLAKLKAMSELKDQKFKSPIVLVGSSGESEHNSSAVKLLRQKVISPKIVFVGGPSRLNIMNEGCGVLTVEVNIPFSADEQAARRKIQDGDLVMSENKVFLGEAKHSSDFDKNKNAIINMLEYLVDLPSGIAILDLDGGISYNTVSPEAAMEFVVDGSFNCTTISKVKNLLQAIVKLEENFSTFRDNGFKPNHSTLNMGKIKTFRNQIRLVWSCRVLPAVPEESYQLWMSEFKKSCEDFGGEMNILSYRRPFSVAKDNEDVKNLNLAAKENNCGSNFLKTVHSSEANVFNRLNIPAVVFGSGQSRNNINGPNEFNSLLQVNKSASVYESLMRAYIL